MGLEIRLEPEIWPSDRLSEEATPVPNIEFNILNRNLMA
jgi:hypothetical protein